MDSVRPFIIQWMFSKRVVAEKEALCLAESILGEANIACDADKFLSGLRESLLFYQLDIRRIPFPDNDEYQWILYNKLEDKVSQLATPYSAEEIDCFKLLLRLIASSNNYQASILEALVQANGQLGKKQCEELINRLVFDQWLQETTIVELEAYLRGESLFEECSICRTLVTAKYSRCSDTDCSAITHKDCHDKLLKAGQGIKCPICGIGALNE